MFSSVIYVNGIAAIPATPLVGSSRRSRPAPDGRLFGFSVEVGAQFDHRLVMRAAYGLRVDAQRLGDFGNLHLAIIQHRQNFALPR